MMQSQSGGYGILCWSLLVLCPTLFHSGLSQHMPFPSQGVTEPPSDDTVHELKEGERLQMSCTLNNSALQNTCNASYMAIRLYRNKHYYTLGSQLPRGEFTLAMVIDKASVNESGPYYCYCHDTSLMAVKVTYSIQAPPEEPKDLRIISENQQSLTVFFNPVRNGSSLNANTTWWLILSTKFSKGNTTCEEFTNFEFRCRYENIRDFRHRDDTTVEIYVENVQGNSSRTVKQLLDHCVKPAPVTVKVKVNDSSQVLLTWRKPNLLHTFYFGGLLYEMTFTSDLYPPHVINVTCRSWDAASETHCGSLRKQVEGLNPYTPYKLRFRSRPVDGGYWSEATVTEFHTPEDVPTVGPGLKPWMYTSIKGTDQLYKIVLYPQELKEQDKAGNITAYKYQFDREWRVNHPTPSVRLNDQALPDAGLTVQMWACTSVGCSVNFSSIILPPADSGVRAPGWLDVEKVNGSHFHLFWESQTLQPSASLQVHWCWGQAERFGQATLVTCKTNMGSREMDRADTSALMNISENHCGKMRGCQIHFGVSVESGEASSGIIWNTCVFEFGKDAEKLLDVNVDTTGDPDTLLVSWSYPCHLTEDYRHGRPVTFESRHFPYSGNQSSARDCEELQGWGENSTALHGENRRVVPGLQAGAGYLFCVRSLTLSATGPWRDRVQRLALHPNAGSSSEVAFAVAVPMVFVVVFAVLASLCLLRQKYRGKKLPIDTAFLTQHGTIYGSSLSQYLNLDNLPSNFESLSVEDPVKRDGSPLRDRNAVAVEMDALGTSGTCGSFAAVEGHDNYKLALRDNSVDSGTSYSSNGADSEAGNHASVQSLICASSCSTVSSQGNVNPVFDGDSSAEVTPEWNETDLDSLEEVADGPETDGLHGAVKEPLDSEVEETEASDAAGIEAVSEGLDLQGGGQATGLAGDGVERACKSSSADEQSGDYMWLVEFKNGATSLPSNKAAARQRSHCAGDWERSESKHGLNDDRKKPTQSCSSAVTL